MNTEVAPIRGNWFDAGSSARHDAILDIRQQQYTVLVDGSPVRSGSLADFSVSDRVGNIARRLSCTDGAMFETLENDRVDKALQSADLTKGASSLTHRMESSWPLAIAAVAIIAIVSFATYRWGIPIAANRIAMALPVTINETVSKGALATMDRVAFSPSTVDSERQLEIQQQFNRLTASLPPSGFNYRLYFRQLEIKDFEIPNAMALPGGEIIVTDAFIELVDDPGELASVLLHELGHVEERHGMRHVIQASAISVIASMTLGNLGGVNELITGVPIFLLQSNYSRSSELAADDFAFTRMTELNIDPIHFANIIRKLGGSGLEHEKRQDNQNTGGYLSTHPGTEERAKKAIEFSKIFNRQ